MSTHAWMVRIAGREDYCFNKGTIAIGWANAKGLDVSGLTLESLREIVRAAYSYTSARSLGQAAGSVWRFTQEIRTNDWIIAPTWTGLNIGRVTGALIYDQEQVRTDNAWRYPVEWKRRDIPRDMASALLQARCSSRQTCIDATDRVSEIEQLCLGEGKPSLDKAIFQSEAGASIGKVLDEHLTPTDLENLVGKLAQKGGALVEKPPQNMPNKKGDVDVLARYSYPKYAVGFQVKKHDDKSQTDEFAVQQIIDAFDDDRLAIDIGCVITTANEFSPMAIALAANAPTGEIRLLTRNDLVQWILTAGISSLD